MIHSVVLTAEAKANIVAIADYIALDSLKYAQRWRQQLRERLHSLRNSPTRHEIAYPVSDVGIEVRQTFFGVYRVLYSIKANRVFIISIRHGAREPLTADEVRRLGNV